MTSRDPKGDIISTVGYPSDSLASCTRMDVLATILDPQTSQWTPPQRMPRLSICIQLQII